MHVACLVDLRHGGIHQRVASATFTPCGKHGLGGIALLPLDLVVLGLEGLQSRMWKVGQNLRIKITPDQLAQPYRSAFTSSALLFQSCACQLPN